jgi:hypothetical protein
VTVDVTTCFQSGSESPMINQTDSRDRKTG